MCGTKSSRVELCAEGGKDASECCGGFRRTTIDLCNVWVTEFSIIGYFDATSGEQVGWEYRGRSNRAVCGGVVPFECSPAAERGLRGPPPSTAGTCPIPACPSPPCADNAPCSADTDCASGWCYVGYCRPVVTDTCANGVLDGAETEVDCGGVCLPCPERATCKQDWDCISGNCQGSPSIYGPGGSWCRPPLTGAGPSDASDASTLDAAPGADASDASAE